MKIRVLSVGKKHDPWVEPGIVRFLERLRPPFVAEMNIIPGSSREGDSVRTEESERLLKRLKQDDFVILLDERGNSLSSPELAALLQGQGDRQVVIIIGGAFGVTPELRERADVVWSLSRLVFPHQLVRLILAEQLYRAQEITRGGQYHHE